MKTNILKTFAAGIFAVSLANAQDAAPATEAPAAEVAAPAAAPALPNMPMMARKELPVSADISNRYYERIFYHWKDNKEKGIIKVYIHTDELAQEREPDVLNYDVLYRDADSNVIYWKDHVAKCVKCFGKPLVEGDTPDSPKTLVYDWDPKKIDESVTSLVMAELPSDDYIVKSENDIRNLKSRWMAPSDKEKGESTFMRAYRMTNLVKWTSPSGEEKNANQMNFVFKKNGKYYYIAGAYALLNQGVYNGFGFPEGVREIEVTDFKEERVKSPIEEVQESIARGPSPVKKADIPKEAWKGPKIESQLKGLVKKYKVKKLIIPVTDWQYERNFFGVMLYRWVRFDIVYEGKNKDGKKAFFYKAGFIGKQMHNGKDFDKNFIMTGVPMSWDREITDWK